MDIKPNKYSAGKIMKFSQFCFCIVLGLASFVFFALSILSNAVYINDHGTVKVNLTNSNNPMGILAQNGITLNDSDVIEYRLGNTIGNNEIDITRSFPIYIEVDGKTIVHNTIGGTVEDALNALNITLGENDRLNCDIERQVSAMERIVITRVDYRTYENEVVIPKEIVTKKSSLIRTGTTRIINQGANGLERQVYKQTLENGKVVDTELVTTTIVKPAIEELQLHGDGSSISTLDYSNEFPLDANGIPLKYEKVLRNQRATGYSARPGAWGASGVKCQAGTVAVRNAEIPYGSKLYIRTPDGNFIYGYSVANDTGTALMDNIIDVDLFYETYDESKWNSVRWVDIYVLETGDNKYYKPRTPISVYK